jgi:hypothetical protein
MAFWALVLLDAGRLTAQVVGMDVHVLDKAPSAVRGSLGAVFFAAAWATIWLFLAALSRGSRTAYRRTIRGWFRALRESGINDREIRHLVRLCSGALRVPVLPFRAPRVSTGAPVSMPRAFMVLLSQEPNDAPVLDGYSSAARAEAESAHSEEVSCFRRPWTDAFTGLGLIEFILGLVAGAMLLLSVIPPAVGFKTVGVAVMAATFGWRWVRCTPLARSVLDDITVSPRGVEVTRLVSSREFPFDRSSLLVARVGPYWLLILAQADGACVRRLVDDLGLVSLVNARRAWEAGLTRAE